MMSPEEYRRFKKIINETRQREKDILGIQERTQKLVEDRERLMIDFAQTLQTFQTAIIQLKLAKHKLELIRQAEEERYENAVKNKGYMIPYRKNYIN